MRAEKYQLSPALVGERDATRSQELSQRVDESMGHGLGAGTELKHRQNLRTGIDGQPEHL